MKKKIAIISNVSWNLYNFRLSLMFAMREAGYEVIAIAPSDKYSQYIIDHGFEYHDLPIDAQGLNPLSDLNTMINLYKIFKKTSPDCVCQYTIKPNIYGSFVANFLNIPTINNIAGLGTLFIKETFVTKIAQSLYKLSQAKANTVFFQNRDDFNFFIDKGIVSSLKADILPGSGVDMKRFQPKMKEKQKKIRFLHISRMIWEKGIQEYVDAAKIIKANYPHTEFCLLGFLDVNNPGAINKEQMNKWVESGIINYLGVSDHVDEVIETADCVVLASYYREGTPKTLLESASAGKPIITTDNIGCRDVVDHGINGYLCEPRSSVDLASKIEDFLHLSSEEKAQMGLESREKVRREFDEKIVIDKYLQALSKAIPASLKTVKSI